MKRREKKQPKGYGPSDPRAVLDYLAAMPVEELQRRQSQLKQRIAAAGQILDSTRRKNALANLHGEAIALQKVLAPRLAQQQEVDKILKKTNGPREFSRAVDRMVREAS